MKQAEIDRQNRNAVRRVMRRAPLTARDWRAALRRQVKAEIEDGYTRGYNEAHEWQMNMRVRDEIERREKE